ncbi:MAG: glycoside hydrolase family 127 protein [Rudaea sp.]|uniref:glycoside hydrolase family 127 protein n=1 Tax=Rudaea sp. TaxID=2136325 RepID=UPI0039E48B8B
MTESASPPIRIEPHGLLGEALRANAAGRLSHFIVDESSPAIAIFGAEHVAQNREGDWYGEHAGKWLYAAAKSAARTQDARLIAHLRRIADFLVSHQDADGYLGTYAPERRFMVKHPPKPKSWNGEPVPRTWDIWIHSYLILGLVEVNRHFPDARTLDAARRIGDLCWRVLTDGGIDICELGNHHGMSATVLLDAAVELHFATDERRYLELALLILKQADANPDLALLAKALGGADASEIATGKAYQLIWNLVGLAKLHRATGAPEYLRAVENLWANIREQHLSLGGGPWGGVAHRSREVFNAPGTFFPQAYVETCSTLAWIQLNRELLAITGAAKYAEEIERSAYNDLLGAFAPNGEDWCYYSYANGKRVHTTYWRCCKSSGAMALEELPALVYSSRSHGIDVNLYAPSTATLPLAQGGRVTIEQQTRYPFDGSARLRLALERPARFALRLRIPSWAKNAAIRVNGERAAVEVRPGDYATLEREWRSEDTVALDLPMTPQIHRRTHRNVQESRAPDGSPVRQEVLRHDYLGITRGPLVYATGLVDGYKTEESLLLPSGPPEQWLHVGPESGNDEGAAIVLEPERRAPLAFVPYYRAGGRVDGAWRLTWMPLAPDANA